MKLTELGLDSGLSAQAQCAAGLRLARVTAVDRNRYVVRNERGITARIVALSNVTGAGVAQVRGSS